MKKTKKLSAMLLASLISAGMVSSISANALYTQTSEIELYDGWSYCEDYSFMNIFGYDVVTVNSDGYSYNGYKKIADEIIFFIPSDGVEIDDIRAAVTEINSKYSVNYRSWQGDYSEYDYEIKTTGGIAISDVKKIVNNIKEQGLIKDAVFLSERYELEHLNIYLGTYPCSYKADDGTIVFHADIVMEYLNENEIPGVIKNGARVEFEDGLSLDEKLEITDKIYKETGAYPAVSVLTSAGSNVQSEIKLFDFIDGDANDDGKLALSDAVAIMQTVGNPDEYGLTAQGEYNADIAGDFDGITNLDALVIQRRLLGLE